MRQTTVVAVILLAVILPGCITPATWTPEARLLAARESFNTTVNALADIVEAGDVLDTDDARRVLDLTQRGAELLDLIEAAVLEGRPVSAALDEFNLILRRLVAEQALAEERRRAMKGGA